ncbi:hypothetical protein SDC9_138751 [bioreactor metagenome]|uniref:Uncharacterized protein n=1 Tax=bioreactor metagenome TaxID=1076179 RepID=A0A645DQ62_9ZZZZ
MFFISKEKTIKIIINPNIITTVNTITAFLLTFILSLYFVSDCSSDRSPTSDDACTKASEVTSLKVVL